jgi:hypothetical protein
MMLLVTKTITALARSFAAWALGASLAATAAVAAPVSFEVRTPAGSAPLNGRLLVAISKDGSAEPRFQIEESYTSQQVFGQDFKGVKPGAVMVIDAKAFGFPVANLKDLPAGDYTVQAIFNRYDTFKTGDGRVLDLPADRGEGQSWKRKPGNPMSKPVKLHVDPKGGVLKLSLDQVMPNVAPLPADTAFLKHIEVRSERLSKFWGREVKLGAWVLLPAGWAEHPNARYPVIVNHGHFAATFRAAPWRDTPPTPDLKDQALVQARNGYAFYQDWKTGRLPRAIVVQVQHANPYYDDSYAVNSANVGPYGDAIVEDLIPEIEHRFRGIGAGWARAVYGGSTGGWESLATQVFYPDAFNGAWAFCPDTPDFHAYQAANLYDDDNAYVRRGPFDDEAVVANRKGDSGITATMAQANHYELALGTRGRSGGQWDAWQAVYSPVGADGYPKPVYDKLTGQIDKSVVAYWKDNYDLVHILGRDWTRLGPKLEGKLHVFVGDADSYYLNNGVYRLEAALKATRAPRSDATFDFGARQPHCYTGAQPAWAKTLGVPDLERYLPDMIAQMLATAPAGADVTSWRY